MTKQNRPIERKRGDGDPRQGLPFHCAHRRRGSVSTATARCPMSAPHDFWTVLQKMGPDFAMSLGFWAVSRECGTIQGSPTWGNADAPRPSKPKPPAKPPRSRGVRAASMGSKPGLGPQTAAGGGRRQLPETFPSFPLARCFGACYCFKHPRVARPVSWQIGLTPIGVADAAAVHRIFPHNLISDALRVVAHVSLLPICAFPLAS